MSTLKIKPYNIRKFLSKSKVDIAQSVGGLDFPGININKVLTTEQEVGKDNIVKIVVTTAGRVAFGKTGIAAPSGALDEVSCYLDVGTHYVYATEDFLRGDATIVAASVEVLTA